ncbi:hypothetical protein EC968_007372 [Mortierella alpina]|nr:hypothetical protein EC968_007372 [Mortierella alpina]
MKTTIAAVLASCAPSLAYALVGIKWSIPNAPALGLNNIEFPFIIAEASHIDGYYFAQQFKLPGSGSEVPPGFGTIGLQTRPDANGKPVIQAVFSSSIKGTTFEPTEKNCQDGAEGGSGATCSVTFNAPYTDVYILRVEQVEGAWEGIALNNRTKAETSIGAWKPPGPARLAEASQTGFVEYTASTNGGSYECPHLPKTTVIFGVPTTSHEGKTVIGLLEDAIEDGDCKERVDFTNKKTLEGGRIVSLGFV